MSARLAVPILLLGLSACGDPFEEACEVLKRVPHGTEIRILEQRLSLPDPRKTLSGSSLYLNRIFEYRRKDGLIVVLGLLQKSETMDYPAGCFVTRGHYMVFHGDRNWVQWEWDDGSRAASSY